MYRDTNFYITKKPLKSGSQGEAGIPAGVLVKGGMDTDSWFRVQRARYSSNPKEANSATLTPGDQDEYLQLVHDWDIEKALIAVGMLQGGEKHE